MITAQGRNDGKIKLINLMTFCKSLVSPPTLTIFQFHLLILTFQSKFIFIHRKNNLEVTQVGAKPMSLS
jgi:hypothetical protein